VLESTRDAVRQAHERFNDKGLDLDLILRQTARLPFYNTSQYSLATLGATKTKSNLEAYVAGFSENARVIFEQFNFTDTIARLARADNLFKICQNFASTDLHPNVVPDRVMSNIYEHLIRRFGAEVNEAAEDFMTPRDVVHLATTLLLDPDDDLFRSNPGLIRTLYDPTCGTGGFLTDAMNHVDGFRAQDKVPPVLIPYGQELEPETHAVALANMLLRRLETEPARDLSANVAGPASTLSKDAFAGKRFHYCLSNPPFGKKWEKDQAFVEREANEKGFAGRFGAGTPRVSDGSMLFIQHLVAKLELPEKGGGRAAIILSGSPLYTGNAGQGESEIRRWLLESDYVEAIVALPTDIFFRTGIGTYIWLLTNKKPAARKGKVQLIDATGIHSPMRKAEGNKRRFISDEQIREVARLYADFQQGETVRIVNHRDFGYRRIKVQRPLRLIARVTKQGIDALQATQPFAKPEEAEQVGWLTLLRGQLGQTHAYSWFRTLAAAAERARLPRVSKPLMRALEESFGVRDPDAPAVEVDGQQVADKEVEDFESVPLGQSIEDYLAAQVMPYVPDASVDASYTDDRDGQVGKVGYEINFNRYFYKYVPPRDFHDIDAELKALEKEIAQKRQALITQAVTKGLHAGVPMKDSDTSNIPVPQHWAVVDFWTVAQQVSVTGVSHEPLLSVYLDRGVIPYSEGGGLVHKPSETLDGYQLVEAGNFVLNNQQAWRGSVGVSKHRGIVSPAYLIFRLSDALDPAFANYQFREQRFVDEMMLSSQGVGDIQRQIKWPLLRKAKVLLPPKPEQQLIAAHLDRVTSRIEALIAQTERSLELLREHRAALITAAVTGKIDLRNEA
jgi:type I restriction enzyme M protein